ncbi:MAG: radical SAM family heme chaperone HemW [Alphaproteobacteria bacterium]|nr:radical SAM family heme chaperone HemW [Alphaproteobacteria bacterium]
MTQQDPGFGIYVHWPFCQSKCPYCDFNSHVRASVDHNAWRTALLQELAHMAALAPDREATSIFFGGGTPSLMEPATVAAVIDAVAGHWKVAGDAEITLEANPSSVEARRFAGYRTAGVNRVSLGIQALDDDSLRALGRRHNAAEARAAIALARSTFPRMSFDLIYARMGQTPDDWSRELAEALGFGTDHLSLYQLTIEPGTQFFTLARRGALDLPPEDDQAAMYEITQAFTQAAGLDVYEVLNHARPGFESRHNITYWRSGEWIGIGPGAHGRLNEAGGTSIARRQNKAPETWLAAVEKDGHGSAESETITGPERLTEVLMMGLRLSQGLSEADLQRAAGVTWDEAIDGDILEHLVETGFLEHDELAVRATPRGRQVLNSVLERLLI